MENFILTLNIVLPVFLVMAVGFVFRRVGLVTQSGAAAMNKAVFQLFLPVSLCQSLMRAGTDAPVDPGLMVFAVAGTLVVFGAALLIVPRFEKLNARRGVMVQGIFRGNYAILGIPLCEALFPQGDGGVCAMMTMATVPVYNALAVVCLEIFRGGRPNARKILIGIAKNPLIWGCLIGYALMRTQLPLPECITSTVSKLASVASPLALFVLGASIDPQAFRDNARALAISLTGKLLLAPLAALAVAYAMGYRGAAFAVLMIAFGAPCAVSSYTMATQMDGDAELAAQQVMLSTVLSAATLFAMIFAFKSMGIF